MKSGWEYVDESGTREKMAPYTLAANVLMSENGPTILDTIRNLIHPIGSIWMTVEDSDPNILFGGTWVQIEDVFLLAAGNHFDLGQTGGEEEHILTTDELPHITGTIVAGSGREGASAGGYGAFRIASGVFSAINVRQNARAATAYAASWPESDATNGKERVTMDFGNEEPHNNMPPFLAVNVWKRIA